MPGRLRPCSLLRSLDLLVEPCPRLVMGTITGLRRRERCWALIVRRLGPPRRHPERLEAVPGGVLAANFQGHGRGDVPDLDLQALPLSPLPRLEDPGVTAEGTDPTEILDPA